MNLNTVASDQDNLLVAADGDQGLAHRNTRTLDQIRVVRAVIDSDADCHGRRGGVARGWGGDQPGRGPVAMTLLREGDDLVAAAGLGLVQRRIGRRHQLLRDAFDGVVARNIGQLRGQLR